MDRDEQMEIVDEETPLLTKERQRTPLPYVQIGIILSMQLAEPIAGQSIYPYINQLVSELDITGGDEEKVGYYVGLIQSLFFATEALTVLHWSSLSDRIGRKPVLLIGLMGSAMSMICFGFSRTFWALVLSRCLVGLLNGNVGVMKSSMGDLTDSSNRADAFAMIPVVWSLGASVGPLIGGTFAKPQERFPGVFKGQFWRDFPYLLPCLIGAGFLFVVIGITAVFLKEPTPSKRRKASDSETQTNHVQTPLRDLLVFPVVISISNYVSLAFLEIAFHALFPLFLAMPLEIGGVGLAPATIGYIMGAWGATNGIFQFFFFAKLVRWLGERRVFVNGITAFIPIFVLMPICSVVAKQAGGPDGWCWAIIGLILFSALVMDMSYGTIFMFITASAPSKNSLGATNGLSQTVVSFGRAVGPAMATSLFSVSVQKNILGGYGVYALFCALSVGAIYLGLALPTEIWDNAEH